MNITRRQLRRIIREQLEAPSEIEIIQDGGVNTLDSVKAGELADFFFEISDAIDDIATTLAQGGRSTRGLVVDPRLENLYNAVDEAAEALYNAQMMASHIRDGTGG
jgi:hypothetical protein